MSMPNICKVAVVFAVLQLLLSPALGQSDAKHSFHGHVVDDLGRQGVPGVRLTLRGSGLTEPKEVTADASGEFKFNELPAGQFTLSGEKAGYFPLSNPNIVLGSANAVDLGPVVMTVKRTLSGEVRNGAGEPLPRIFVQAIPVRAGKLGLQAGGRGILTNESGQFSLEELRPARYVLLASTTASRDSKRSSVVLPQFYPGGDTPMIDAGLDVTTLQALPAIFIRLDERPGVSLEGVVVPSDFAPKGTEVMVGLLIPGVPTSTGIGLVFTQVGIPFRIRPVPPGQYLLLATLLDPPSGTIRRALTTVTVGDLPMVGLELRIPEPAPINGRIDEERTARQPASESNPKAPKDTAPVLEPAVGVGIRVDSEALRAHGMNAVTSDAQGRFSAKDTVLGEMYSLTFSRATFPIGTYLARVTQAERDLTPGPLDVVAGGGDVRVLLKADGATVGGSVYGKEGAAEAFVVLAPKNREAAHWLQTTTSHPKDGSFQFSGIAPGRYDLLAFSRNEDSNYLNPDYLGRFQARAVTVEALPNGVASYRLELIMVGR